jgi:hypothetical protein
VVGAPSPQSTVLLEESKPNFETAASSNGTVAERDHCDVCKFSLKSEIIICHVTHKNLQYSSVIGTC